MTKTKKITITGIMAALIMIMTAYSLHIPIGANGGYLHFGDAIIYLTASILPTPYALTAAAIGSGLADLFTAPMWLPATIIIKMLIVIPFSCKSAKIITKRNCFATVFAYFISGFGYFFAEFLLFETWSVFPVSIGQTLFQSVGSAIVFLALGATLDKAQIKNRL